MTNRMKEIRVEKVVVNIGCGTGGEKLDKAKKVLEKLTGKKIVETCTNRRTTFGVAKGRPIGCKVTLRGKDAAEFLKRVLDAVDFKLPESVFDAQGDFSFGVKEHISIPGVRYEPDIGIYGMDVCVRLERRGYRVMRKRNGSAIGNGHRIKPEEARAWAEKNLNIKVGE
jgi:large subunit ribosomal protein L5